MKELLDKIRADAESLLNSADSLADIEELRVRFLGKKGELTSILKGMGLLSDDERPAMGKLANDTREHIEKLIADKTYEIAHKLLAARLEKEKADITLPGVKPVTRNNPLCIHAFSVFDGNISRAPVKPSVVTCSGSETLPAL